MSTDTPSSSAAAVPSGTASSGARTRSEEPENGFTRSPGSAIAVCIVCRNEADRLGECLESVQWADEILVMDLMSTDGSAEVARRLGARLVVREPHPIVEPLRNEIAEHARCDWILALDPDERVTPGLARELRRVASNDGCDAVRLPRMNYDLGYAPSSPLHRYEPQLRMYRRSRVQWPNIPNALPIVPQHRTYSVAAQDDLVMVHDRSRNVPEILDRSLRYAPLQALSMIDQGEVFTARGMFRAMGRVTYKEFVRGQAWKDGVPGMLRAALLVGFKFYVWTAFWQLSGAKRTAEDERFVRRLGIAMEVIRVPVGAVGRAARFLREVARHRTSPTER